MPQPPAGDTGQSFIDGAVTTGGRVDGSASASIFALLVVFAFLLVFFIFYKTTLKGLANLRAAGSPWPAAGPWITARGGRRVRACGRVALALPVVTASPGSLGAEGVCQRFVFFP